MFRTKYLVVFLLVVLSPNINIQSLKAEASNKAHSLKALVKLPNVRDVQISPDGKHYSVVIRDGKQEKLAVFNTETKKPVGVFHVRGDRRGVGRVDWINDERLVYGVTESYLYDKTLRNTGELWGVNFDGSKHKLLFGMSVAAERKQTETRIKQKKADKGHHRIIDHLENDDEHILIAFYPWVLDGRYWRTNYKVKPSVYKLNINSGRKRFVTRLNLPVANAIVDSKGLVRFSVGVNSNNRMLVSYRKDESDDWSNFNLSDFPGTNVIPLSFTESDNSVYVSATVDGGTRGLFRLNLDEQTFEKKFHDPIVDMSMNVKDYSQKRVIIVGTEHGYPTYEYLEKKDPKAILHRDLVAAFPGHNIEITSSTRDGNFSIVLVYSDRNSGDFYLFDSKTMSAQYLFAQQSWLDPELMAEMKPITVKTRDNIEIHGYLTLPNGVKKNLPLVVHPHGGPHGPRDSWKSHWEVQALANSGYAVLQINFRGSGGYGQAFREAGYGKWGTLMQDDITDATLAMIDQGIADKNRICIYGKSYGGYASLMGVVREPGLYKCAIGSMGVYDLQMMFERGDIPSKESGLAYLKEVLGQDTQDQKRRSPVYNVDKIKASVFLIHGERDERAPIEQAEALKDAFDKINKKYEWHKLDDEGHGYYDEQNRLELYTKILSFLDKNIGE